MADLIITCEHASAYIPQEYVIIMNTPSDIEEHRIFDRGALESAEAFAHDKGLSVHSFPVSRLLIDANRSISTKSLFSKYALKLPLAVRYKLIEEYYIPFRQAVLADAYVAVHLSFHSFTPVMNGKVRDYDAGILYDPARKPEAKLAKELVSYLNKAGVHTVSNKPYKGTADGHTTSLRKEFSPDKYIGLEIELSHRLTTDQMVEISHKISSFF